MILPSLKEYPKEPNILRIPVLNTESFYEMLLKTLVKKLSVKSG
jgi:hypothetical protein